MLVIERLKSKKEISFVFDKGFSVSSFPIKLFYIKNMGAVNSSVAFTVGKKKISLAVDRNLVKRRMREAFRLNCLEDDLFVGHTLVFVYLGVKITPLAQIAKGFRGVMEKFNSKKK